MRIKNTNQTIFSDGGTSDIIKVVMMAYDIEKDPQIEALAIQLKGKTIQDTCHNIWQYLINNITYRADVGKQEIKSPARLVNDRTGDCKSYSLFTACILRYLGIDHVFRFVSYDNRKEATHVYVVARGTQNTEQIIIDAVAAQQADIPFNQELKYTYHCDMSDKGTTIAYLAGIPKKMNRYKKHIGAVVTEKDTERYKVWIGDEHQASITPGKHYLYALFDLNLEMINIAKTDKERAYYFDQLDIVASLLHAYNHVDGDTDQFKRMAFIVCGMISDGVFINSEINENERADKLDDLFLIIDERYHNGYFPAKYDNSTWEMILNEVAGHNVIKNTQVAGIGQTTEYDVISKIKEAGVYYIYTFLSQSEIDNAPTVVIKKQDIQQKTLAWQDDINTFQTTAGMSLSIRSGIVARTGKTPEQYIADLKAGKVIAGVGVVPILLTINAVIAMISGLIAIIVAIFGHKSTVVKPSDSTITSGAFDPTKDYSKTATTTSSLSSIALPLAIGAAAIFGLFSIKK